MDGSSFSLRSRLSRRHALSAFGLAGLGVIVAACGGAPAAAPTSAPAQAAPTSAPAPAAPTQAPAAATQAPAAAPTTAAAQAATTPIANAPLKDVARNKTLIAMQGGNNGQNPA